MSKIYIEVSAGELFDKISILEIKKRRIKDKEKLIYVETELRSLNETLKKNKLDKIDGFLKDCLQDLTNINIDLWEAEDLKRKYEKGIGKKKANLLFTNQDIYHQAISHNSNLTFI